MGRLFIHFRGLKPEEQGWYYNRRGAPVFVHPGDWARLDPKEHPELRYLLETGAAVISDSPPDGVEILTDETDPNWARRRIEKARSGAKQIRAAQGPGLTDVHQLTPAEVERARELFLPRELPEVVADGYVDARVVDRHRASLAANVPLPLYPNVVILHRLAWLLCRAYRSDWASQAKAIRTRRSQWVEDYYLEWGSARSELRLQAERRFPLPPEPDVTVGDILVRWGVCGDRDALSASTLYRYRQNLGMSRQEIDFLILSALTVNRPVLVVGRFGAGVDWFNLGAYVPQGQASRLRRTGLAGVAWWALPHPSSSDDPELKMLVRAPTPDWSTTSE